MNEQSYEDYIRSILGYPNNSINNMCNSCYDNNSYTMEYSANAQNTTDNTVLESCYPEIYKIVYPMITKRCASNSMPVTRELVENMTDEIYSAVESTNEIGINITLKNEVKTTQNRTTNQANSTLRREARPEDVNKSALEQNRGEDRQFRNNNLRDLIKVLLIRELIGRPGFPGNRPPMPPRPPRPPFPGGNRPGGPGPRPPIIPRGSIEYNYPTELYEM